MAENLRQREDWSKQHEQHDFDVDTPHHHHMHAEDRVSTVIEEQTSKVPSVAYLVLAGACMGASLGLQVRKEYAWANFVGLWAPSLLIIGLYNKLVKRLGH